jgi:hypothetical protein
MIPLGLRSSAALSAEKQAFQGLPRTERPASNRRTCARIPPRDTKISAIIAPTHFEPWSLGTARLRKTASNGLAF